jgi:hypothetical protein
MISSSSWNLFPTVEAAIGCLELKAYQETARLRRSDSGVGENVIVEGGDATPR